MNPSSRCSSTRENAIGKVQIDPMVTVENTSKPKSVIIPYDQKPLISQSNGATFSNIDNDTTQDRCSNLGLSASSKKRNCCARRKVSVINKKKSIALRPLVNTKKITKIRSTTCDDGKTENEQRVFSEITERIENSQKQFDAAKTSPTFRQGFTSSNNVENFQKMPEITINDRNLTNEVAHRGTSSSTKGETFNVTNRNTGFRASQDKPSKIPRIKPNSFLSAHEESRVRPGRKVSIEKNKFQRSSGAKSSSARSEEESYIESGGSTKREVSNVINRQEFKSAGIPQTIRENPTNLWSFEKSSEMDADEEPEGDLSSSPINYSRIITGAGDDPRSATLLKSLTLKCKCPSCDNSKHTCNDHKHTSTNHTDRRTESDSWSSPEVESARKWKMLKHHKFVNVSTEGSNFFLDYSDVNYTNVKGTAEKNKKGTLNAASHVKKSSVRSDATRMNIHQTTSFSFFNVFFDIVFWPFVFLRAKR